MSVLIKGMEMQKGCYLCPCNKDDGFGFFTCGVTHSECDFIRLPTDCPLIPVPKHGRLIDADALLKDITPTDEDEDNGAKLLMNVFCQVVKTRPTIIPEDGEDS